MNIRDTIIGFLAAVGIVGGSWAAFVRHETETVTVPAPPASGIQGFDAAAFCKDPLTRVVDRSANTPDVLGHPYELVRVRDGVEERVAVLIQEDGTSTGMHYYSTAVGPAQEPAIVSADAIKCIISKVK
jgi:hypothetical protein